MTRLAWGGLGVLLACASGCVSSEARKSEAARDAVRRFFEALPSADCAQLGPSLAGPADTCPATLEDLRSHGVSLLEVLDAQVDGRDPDAVLVRARVARDGRVREQPLLVRVERHPEGWKLRL